MSSTSTSSSRGTSPVRPAPPLERLPSLIVPAVSFTAAAGPVALASSAVLHEMIRAPTGRYYSALRAEASLKCFRCKEVGHFAMKCPNTAKGAGACFVCGDTSHAASSCAADVCFVCDEAGHRATSCPNREAMLDDVVAHGRPAGYGRFLVTTAGVVAATERLLPPSWLRGARADDDRLRGFHRDAGEFIRALRAGRLPAADVIGYHWCGACGGELGGSAAAHARVCGGVSDSVLISCVACGAKGHAVCAKRAATPACVSLHSEALPCGVVMGGGADRAAARTVSSSRLPPPPALSGLCFNCGRASHCGWSCPKARQTGVLSSTEGEAPSRTLTRARADADASARERGGKRAGGDDRDCDYDRGRDRDSDRDGRKSRFDRSVSDEEKGGKGRRERKRERDQSCSEDGEEGGAGGVGGEVQVGLRRGGDGSVGGGVGGGGAGGGGAGAVSVKRSKTFTLMQSDGAAVGSAASVAVSGGRVGAAASFSGDGQEGARSTTGGGGVGVVGGRYGVSEAAHPHVPAAPTAPRGGTAPSALAIAFEESQGLLKRMEAQLRSKTSQPTALSLPSSKLSNFSITISRDSVGGAGGGVQTDAAAKTEKAAKAARAAAGAGAGDDKFNPGPWAQFESSVRAFLKTQPKHSAILSLIGSNVPPPAKVFIPPDCKGSKYKDLIRRVGGVIYNPDRSSLNHANDTFELAGGGGGLQLAPPPAAKKSRWGEFGGTAAGGGAKQQQQDAAAAAAAAATATAAVVAATAGKRKRKRSTKQNKAEKQTAAAAGGSVSS